VTISIFKVLPSNPSSVTPNVICPDFIQFLDKNKGFSSFNYMKNLRGKVMHTMKMYWGRGACLVLDGGE
jgi:hypothetical protein